VAAMTDVAFLGGGLVFFVLCGLLVRYLERI
jgi:hypothetical protein